MNKTEEEGVFEINDFTNATDWENLISLIERALTQLHSTLLSSQQTISRAGNASTKPLGCLSLCDEINLGGQKYQLSYFQNDRSFSPVSSEYRTICRRRSNAAASVANDFSSLLASGQENNDYVNISKWFGLTRCVLLKCLTSSVKGEHNLHMVKSAINVVCVNLCFPVPILVQSLEDWRCYLSGSCVPNSEVRYIYDMIHLKSAPNANLTYMSGLLALFREHAKLSSTVQVDVSACFTYALYDWTEFTLDRQEMPDIGADGNVALTVDSVFEKTLGTMDDPVSEIELSACWSCMSCSVVEESESYSDLTPLNAPSWWLTVKMSQKPNCMLTQHMLNIIRMSSDVEAFQQQLQFAASDATNAECIREVVSLFQMPQLTTLLSVSRFRKAHQAIYVTDMSPEFSRKLVDELFEKAFSHSHYTMDKVAIGLKSAPANGLVYNLCWLLCSVYFLCGNSEAILMVWSDFLRKVRELFDAGIFIPSVVVEKPDFSSCLLNQKLQFLNCCIKRRLDREIRCNESETIADEFFDCDDKNADSVAFEEEGSDVRIEENDNESNFDDSQSDSWFNDPEWNGNGKIEQDTSWRTPEGRCKLFKGGESLLRHPRRPMYIPLTQESPIMTEFMLEKETHFLENLGATSDASELRMLIQSRTLLSDMECFKAANPGCVMEDFIRWYSPRDWSESEGLSVRMLQPDSIWTKNWEMALPVPASRQKRLFDDTKEAENMLSYLSKLDKQALSDMILNPLLHNCFDKLIDTEMKYSCVDSVKANLAQLVESYSALLHDESLRLGRLISILKHFIVVELVHARADSLQTKFCHLSPSSGSKKSTKLEGGDPNDSIYEDFVTSLMSSSSVPVIGASRGPVGDVICHLFSLANRIQREDDYSFERAKASAPITDQTFPAPVRKEYIFTADCDETSQHSGDTAQLEFLDLKPQKRLYAGVSHAEFRLAVAKFDGTEMV